LILGHTLNPDRSRKAAHHDRNARAAAARRGGSGASGGQPATRAWATAVTRGRKRTAWMRRMARRGRRRMN
jgi:hypothetical protein